MATYYFDSVNGNDANAGTDINSPKATYDAWSQGSTAAGDRFLFKYGTTQLITTANKSLIGGTATNPVYYGAYGDSNLPKPKFITTNTATGVFNQSRRSYYIVDNWHFDMRGAAVNSMYISAMSLGTVRGVTVKNCIFENAGGDNPGLYIGKENHANDISGVLVDSCIFRFNSADGITILGVDNSIVRNCVGYHNGFGGPNGGHNFRITVRTGYTTSGVLIDNCVSFKSLWNREAPFQEGHGFSFDDLASGCTMRRCLSFNNEGLGFSINNGDNNIIESCVAFGNAMRAVSMGSGTGNTVRNCTFFNNNQGQGNSTPEIHIVDAGSNATVSNNIINCSKTYGVYFGSATSCTASNNNIYNATDTVLGGTETNTTTHNPQLNSSFVPQNSALFGIGATTTKGDFYGKPFKVAPAVGAVESSSTRTITNKNIITRTITNKTIRLFIGVVG